VASRLEALTREHDAAIAASRSLIEAVQAVGRSDLAVGFVPLPAQQIRGRRDLQDVHVLPRATLTEAM
jgi:class 3 adenylate cyclase